MVAFRPALSFYIRAEAGLGNSLSVGGGIGSFQKGNLPGQIALPHKVADRRTRM